MSTGSTQVAPDLAKVQLVAIDDYNRRAVAALERAQALSGARSANGFARLLAERASGSPSASTYRRWILGEAVVPAWAVEVAAEVAGTTVQGLLEDERPELDAWRAQIEESIGRLEGEIIELREHLDLPRQGRGREGHDRSLSRERIAT
jgi:hypothetical protein